MNGPGHHQIHLRNKLHVMPHGSGTFNRPVLESLSVRFPPGHSGESLFALKQLFSLGFGSRANQGSNWLGLEERGSSRPIYTDLSANATCAQCGQWDTRKRQTWHLAQTLCVPDPVTSVKPVTGSHAKHIINF
jgi:hypothetical protein